MKAIFTFLLIIIFWLNAVSNDSVSGKQKQTKPVKHETAVAGNTNIIQADSVSGYSINVNGGSNSVRINNESLAVKSLASGEQQKSKPNSIEINGEGNLVNIQQTKDSGKVNIQQTGTGNQVNITQTNKNKVK